MKIDYETDYDVGQDNVQVMGMDMRSGKFLLFPKSAPLPDAMFCQVKLNATWRPA